MDWLLCWSRSTSDLLQPDLDLRLQKIRDFHPYVHPSSPGISAEGVWARFSPQLHCHFQLLKSKSDSLTLEAFALMGKLYVDQGMVPADTLKQILMMHQNQLGAVPDPLLTHSDLNLFGFKSMEDWFGVKFISLVSQFILNAAQMAQERGYSVTTEEVRAELFRNIVQGYQQISKEERLSADEVQRYFQMRARSLGLDEGGLVQVWKKVILFRRLFEDASDSVLLDSLACEQFNQYAKENARICLYQLPSCLHLADFRSMMKLQVYLEAIAPASSDLRFDLRLPCQFATGEQVEKKVPELIERKLELEWSSTSKEDLCKAISVKQSWDWETASVNFETLRKNFPELANVRADTDAERFSALKGLNSDVRVKIDRFARIKIVEEHPEWVSRALESAPVNTDTVSLKTKGGRLPF